MANKTPLFARHQSGGVFTVVDERQGTGDIWWVDSGSSTGLDAAGYGQNPDAPFLTLDYAIGNCTANNGDIIYVMPGHAETLTTAGDVACDVAGISIIGLGEGADRPTFTFSSTDNTASVLITAASTKIKNIIGVCGDDGLTNPFHVQAADCELDIEWHDGSATVEAAAVIVGTDAADRLLIKIKHVGFTAGSGNTNVVLLDGSNQARIIGDFYGLATSAFVNFNDTSVVDVNVEGYFYNHGTTDLSKNVKDTATGSTWFVHGYDGAAGCEFDGGSGKTPAKDDVSVIASDVVIIMSDVKTLGSSQSDIIIIQSDLKACNTRTIAIASDLILVDTVVDKISSDTVIVQSDLKACNTRTITIASDLVVADGIVDNIKSDLIITQSDVKAMNTRTITVASDVVIVQSDLKAANTRTITIASDLILVDTVVDKISSDTIIVQSDLKAANTRTITIASDLILVDTVVDKITSDLVIVQSDLKTITLQKQVKVIAYDSNAQAAASEDVVNISDTGVLCSVCQTLSGLTAAGAGQFTIIIDDQTLTTVDNFTKSRTGLYSDLPCTNSLNFDWPFNNMLHIKHQKSSAGGTVVTTVAYTTS